VRFFVTAGAPARYPILQLASGFVERPMSHAFRALELFLLGRFVVYDQLVAGEPEVDGDSEAVPMLPMVACQLDDDVARDDAIAEALEVFGALLDVHSERLRVRHRPERQLKWGLQRA
jgi:hypothetical protein